MSGVSAPTRGSGCGYVRTHSGNMPEMAAQNPVPLTTQLYIIHKGRWVVGDLLEAEDSDDGAGDHDGDGGHEHQVQHLVLPRAGGHQPVTDLGGAYRQHTCPQVQL